MKKLIVLLMIAALLLASCQSLSDGDKSSGGSSSISSDTTGTKATASGSSSGGTSSKATGGQSSTTKSKSGTTTTKAQNTDKFGVLTEQARSLGMTEDMLNRSVVSKAADDARLANVMKKAKSGQSITIGVIGGSITQGTAASNDSKTYARQVADWWVKTFPQSQVKFVNAGLGATSSVIGVHRIEADLLSQKPDFVIVEFAVNDGKSTLFKETYENVLRRILNQPQKPAVLQLFMMTQEGDNAQYSEAKIGEHYGLPMISYKEALWPEIQNNALKWTDISPDNIHPNDKGHAMAAELVKNYLRKVFNDLNSLSTTVKAVPQPLTSSKYENAMLYTNKNLTATSLGSFQINNDAFWQFKNGWTAKSGTDPLVFDVKGKNVFVMVKRSIGGKGGKATIKLNGKVVTTVDSDFPNGWGDYVDPVWVCDEASGTQQHIEIQLIPDGSKEFTVLGVLVS